MIENLMSNSYDRWKQKKKCLIKKLEIHYTSQKVIEADDTKTLDVNNLLRVRVKFMRSHKTIMHAPANFQLSSGKEKGSRAGEFFLCFHPLLMQA